MISRFWKINTFAYFKEPLDGVGIDRVDLALEVLVVSENAASHALKAITKPNAIGLPALKGFVMISFDSFC